MTTLHRSYEVPDDLDEYSPLLDCTEWVLLENMNQNQWSDALALLRKKAKAYDKNYAADADALEAWGKQRGWGP